MNGWELMIAALIGVAVGVILTLVVIYAASKDEE